MFSIFDYNYIIPFVEEKSSFFTHINSEINYDFKTISEDNLYFVDPIIKSIELEDTMIKSDEKTTTYGLTINNNNLINPKKNNPYYYSYDTIKQKLMEINSNFLNVFQKNEKVIEAENEMQLIRIKNIKWFEIKEEKNNEKINKNRLGRKRKSDKTPRNHNKYKSDNIMKKIKAKFYDYIVKFVNKILKKYNEGREGKDKVIKELNFNKYINKLTIRDDRKSLNLSLKDLLSQEISPKFKDDINSNIVNIKKILEQEKDNEIINYVFNLKFIDWINIFTQKRDIQSYGNISKIASDEIEKSMPKIDDLIKEIFEKNTEYDEISNGYISCIIFYLFNYENWFIIRNPRK